MYIFLDKTENIWLDPDIFEIFESEPFVSDKSLFFARSWFVGAGIFYEKKIDIFVDHRRSFEIGCRERITNLIHELDDFEIVHLESCLLRDFSESGLHSCLFVFHVSFWENILHISSSIFPRKHENIDFLSSFPIYNTTSTLFIEFCHGKIKIENKKTRVIISKYSKIPRKSERKVDFSRFFHTFEVFKHFEFSNLFSHEIPDWYRHFS